ncbi:Uncharacterised protein [uncultured archaeon]|nr:Uncharacterised protein [uncultured archaeon]
MQPKMKTWMAVIFAALMPCLASAFVEGQSYISIGETPYDYAFTVENASSQKKALEVSFSMPVKYEANDVPQWVMPDSKEEVKIRIFPETGFEGTTYAAKISISLGGDVAEKTLNITFANENGCPVTAKITGTTSGNNGKNTASFEFMNKSYKPKEVKISGVAAGGFETTGAQEKLALGPFETRPFEAILEGDKSYEGMAEFTLECAGSAEKAKAIGKVKLEGKAGFIASGLALLSGIGNASGGAAKGNPGLVETTVDVFLAAIAAILLIAFIARLVKFTKKGVQ